MEIRLNNKVAVVTGASKGIGFETARLFGNLGAKVVLCARNQDRLSESVYQLQSEGLEVSGQVCDVSDAKQVRALSDFAVEEYGKVDLWVSNAGIYPQYSIIDTPEELWDQLIAINLKSVYLSAREVYRLMKETGGVFLIASSFAAKFPSIGSGGYAASKSAVDSMIRTLAAELAPYGIRVNGYMPGVILTDMTQDLTTVNTESILSQIALQRFGETKDVAWALAFLASDYARYITGTTLEISGGKMGVQNPRKAWDDYAKREEIED